MRNIKKIRRQILLVKFGLHFSFFFLIIFLVLFIRFAPSAFASGALSRMFDRSEETEDINQSSEGPNVIHYFLLLLGIIISTTTLFLLVSYRSQLLSLMKVGEKRYLKITPTEAVRQFFEIMVKMMIKNSNLFYAFSSLQTLKERYGEDIPALNNVVLLNTDGRVSVAVNNELEWKDFYSLYSLIMSKLDITKSSFITIAEYEKKEDLVLILRNLSR